MLGTGEIFEGKKLGFDYAWIKHPHLSGCYGIYHSSIGNSKAALIQG